jgi:hypothetical protein
MDGTMHERADTDALRGGDTGSMAMTLSMTEAAWLGWAAIALSVSQTGVNTKMHGATFVLQLHAHSLHQAEDGSKVPTVVNATILP